MLMSIACILLLGMMMGWLCKKVHLPGLLGMLVTGIVLGPYALKLIDASILNISSELRKIALIIILARAGLSLNLEDLKKVGRLAILMCFVPACFEILGMILLDCCRSSLTCRDCSENAEAYGRKLRDRKRYSSTDPCGSFCG